MDVPAAKREAGSFACNHRVSSEVIPVRPRFEEEEWLIWAYNQRVSSEAMQCNLLQTL